VGEANAPDRRGSGGRGVPVVELATAAPAAAAGRTLARWPDAYGSRWVQIRHEEIANLPDDLPPDSRSLLCSGSTRPWNRRLIGCCAGRSKKVQR